VLADGPIAKSGGMVVKNVTGYDMSKLYIGSFGTLAVLTQANFKTLPIPPAARAFLAPLPERTLGRALAHVQELGGMVSAAFAIDGFRKNADGESGTDGRLVVLIESSQALLERATRDLRSALGQAGIPETTLVDAGAREVFERALNAYVATIADRSITYRILGTHDGIAERIAAMQALTAKCELTAEVIADVMNGDVILRVSDREERSFAAKIESFDEVLHEAFPRAIIIAGNSPMRRSLDVWGTPPLAIAQMRTIKERFDPHGTLNPGRFVGGI
jgi:glycolate oxidase FAD binding subunit